MVPRRAMSAGKHFPDWQRTSSHLACPGHARDMENTRGQGTRTHGAGRLQCSCSSLVQCEDWKNVGGQWRQVLVDLPNIRHRSIQMRSSAWTPVDLPEGSRVPRTTLSQVGRSGSIVRPRHAPRRKPRAIRGEGATARPRRNRVPTQPASGGSFQHVATRVCRVPLCVLLRRPLLAFGCWKTNHSRLLEGRHTRPAWRHWGTTHAWQTLVPKPRFNERMIGTIVFEF